MGEDLLATAATIRQTYDASDLGPETGTKAKKRAQSVAPAVAALQNPQALAPSPVSGTAPATPETAERIASTPIYDRATGNPSNGMRDDIIEPGLIERFAWWIGGEPDDDPTGSFVSAIRNSFAKGVLEGQNTMPFGETGAYRKAVRKRDVLVRDKARLDAGDDPAVVFPMSDDPEFEAQALRSNYTLWLAQAEDDIDHYSSTMSHYARAAELFPEGMETQAFRNAEGFGDAAKAFLFEGNFWMNMANLVFPSMVQFAPTAVSLAVESALLGKFKAPLAMIRGTQMATQGAVSFSSDSDASFLNYMAESGVNLADPAAIARFGRSAKAMDVDAKADRHGIGVSVPDMLSVGIAGGRFPRIAPKVLGARMPRAAKAYESIMGNAYGYAAVNFLAQGQLQGVLGATGEAAGQVLAEGKITDAKDIFLEYVGEFATAPMEMVVAAKSAHDTAQVSLARAEQGKEAVQMLGKMISESKAVQENAESFASYLSEVEKAHPEGANINIAVPSMKQDEVEQLKLYLPTLVPKIDNAIATGTDVALSLTEFGQAALANPEILNTIGDYVSVPASVLSVAEANNIVDRMEASVNDYRTFLEDGEGKRAGFKESMKVVADEVTQAIDAGFAPTKDGNISEAAQRGAIVMLTLNHISNMALETGMSPEAIWNEFGFNVLSEEKGDVVRNADGSVGAVSDRAKQTLAGAAENSFAEIQTADEARANARPRYIREGLKRKSDRATVPIIALDDLPYKNAAELRAAILETLGGSVVPVKGTRQRMLFSNNGLSRSLKKRGREHSAVYSRLFDVVASSEYDGTERNDGKAGHTTDQDVYHAAVSLDGKLYAVRIKADVITADEKKMQALGLQKQAFDTRYVDHAVARVDVSEVKGYHGQLPYVTFAHKGTVSPASTSVVSRASLGALRGNVKPSRIKKGVLRQGTFGEFMPSAETIIRWANADRSTLLHETGHWFLDTRIRLAQRLRESGQTLSPDQQRFVDVTEKAVQWTSGKSLSEFSLMSLDEQRPAHEKFARTYEQYLKDGKAPTSALERVFSRFSAWLKSIYNVLNAVPGSEMNPEVQELFDELFTAGEQVREAQIRRDLFLGKAVPDDGIAKLADIHTDATTSELLKRRSEAYSRVSSMRGEVRHTMELYADYLKKKYEREIREADEATTESKALKFFRTVDPETKKTPRVSAQELKELGVPEATVNTLVDLKIATTRKSGVLPAEDLSHELGFGSADEMAAKLSTYHKPTKEEISEAAQDRLEEENPELATEESIAESADIALFNSAASNVALGELNWLNRAVGNDVTTQASIDILARGALSGVKVRDLKRFIRDAKKDAARAADAARRALGKMPAGSQGRGPEQNLRNAVVAKRQEAYQIALARMAQEKLDKLTKERDKLHKRFNGEKGSQSKSIPGEYLNVIQYLLMRLGICEKGNATDTWNEFWDGVPEGHALDDPEVIAAKLLADSILRAGITADDISISELEKLFDLTETLISVGRREGQVQKDGKLVELKTLCDNIASEIVTANPKDKGTLAKTWGDTRVVETLSHLVRKVDAAHSRIQDLFDRLCGKRFGALFEGVGKWADACDNHEAELRRVKSKEMFDAFGPLKKLFYNHKPKFYAELEASLTPTQVVAIALNMGNAENIQRLCDGSLGYKGIGKITKKWTPEALASVVGKTLSAEQIKAIQNVWDVISSLKGERFALEKRLGNRLVKAVEPQAVSFVTASGEAVTLRGGYYPIIYDYQLSSRAGTEDVKREGLKALQRVRGAAYTRNSRLKSRTANGSGEPVELTIEAGFQGLDEVIHSLCWKEFLMDANKIFSSKSPVFKAIQDKWGYEYNGAIRQWLADIASDGKGNEGIGNFIARELRQNISLASLGFNVVTALIQPIGYTQTVTLLGGKWALAGMARTLSNPHRAYQFAYESSEVIRDRMTSQFRELAEAQKLLTGSRAADAKLFVTRWAFKPIAFCQFLIDVPTWTGAYERAIDAGCSHEEAVARADRDLKTAQGSGRLADLSGVERGGEVIKLLTVFYTFFNTAYNLARLTGSTTKGLDRAYRILMLCVVQAVLESCLRSAFDAAGGDADWDKGFEKKILLAPVEFNLGMLVGLREMSTIPSTLAGLNTFGYSGPSSFKSIADVYKLATQIGQGDIDAGLAKAGFRLVGDIFGIPTTAITRAIDAYDNNGDIGAYLFGYKGER